jgi:methionyl-tRNA formyltransferase
MLQSLIDRGFEVLGAYTRDDEPGMKIWHNQLGHASLKDECAKRSIPFYEGMKVNSDESMRLLKSLELDIIFSCFWGEIIKQEILDIPRLGIYNLHTAYLPMNRGSRPIPWALIRGDSFTGLTIHKMYPGVDNGPIVSQVKVYIGPEDDAATLYEKVCRAGLELFRQTLPSFLDESFVLKEQLEADSTYQPRGEPFGGQVNNVWNSEQKNRFQRAFTFPPFRGYRLPPSNIGDTPNVYFIIDSQLPKVLLPKPAGKFKFNGIGNKQIRSELRSALSVAKNTGIELDNHVGGMYTVHDILRMLNCPFCVSDIKLANDFSKPNTQPYRYENGLLEIPAVKLINQLDLKALLLHAKSKIEGLKYDYFIPILCDGPLTIEEISEEVSSSNFSQLTFTQVYSHYDTEYESISS